MKDKINAELKKRYTGQLSQKLIDEISERLVSRVSEESQITGVIDELENSAIRITDLYTESDRRVNEARTKWKEDQPKPPDPPKPPTPPTPPPHDEEVTRKITELENQLKAIRQTETSRELSQKLTEQMKAKGIPISLANGINVESEEKITETLTDLEKRYNDIKQEMVNEGIQIEIPKRTPGMGDPDKAIDQDIQELSKKMD